MTKDRKLKFPVIIVFYIYIIVKIDNKDKYIIIKF